MAKKNTEETKEIIVFPQYQEMIENSTQELITSTIGTNEQLAILKQTYSEMTVNGIQDMAGYKVVVEGITKLRNIRTSVEKRRKELTEPALEFQRRLKAEADRITSEISPLEEKLKSEKVRIDDAKEAARREEFQRRVTLLTESAWQLAGGFYVLGALQIHPDQIADMEEQQLDFYLKEGEREIERQRAEAARKQAEEAQRLAEQEKLRLERQAIEAERAELAKLRAELEAQKTAIETTYETVVQPEPVAPTQEQPSNTQAPEPTPTAKVNVPKMSAPEVSVPIRNESAPTGYTGDFMIGYDTFRIQLIGLLQDTEQKITRHSLIEWAKTTFPK